MSYARPVLEFVTAINAFSRLTTQCKYPRYFSLYIASADYYTQIFWKGASCMRYTVNSKCIRIRGVFS